MSHTPFEPSWGIPRKESLKDYLAWVRTEATGDNGVCGIKIHWSQLRHLQRILSLDAPGVLAFLAEHLPNLVLVRLYRNDALRQALSYHRAVTEQRWWQLATHPDAPSSGWDPDFAEVARLHRLLTHHAARWAELLLDAPWPCRAVSYEEILADLTGTVDELLQLFGIPAVQARSAAGATEPVLRRQSDLQTEFNVHRYLSWRHTMGPRDNLDAWEVIS